MTSMIKAICSYFNYNNNPVRKSNYEKFRKNFAHDLITVELATDASQFFIDDAIQIVAKPENFLWQKERCFNIALETLPDSADKIVWVDTDVVFHNDDWLTELDKLLDEKCFGQPFERVVELDNHFNHNLNCFSYAKLLHSYIHHNEPIGRSLAVGLSWGCRRSLLPNGFYDKHIMGSNDGLQLYAWLGDIVNYKIFAMPNNLIQDFLNYYQNLDKSSGVDVGYCKGVVEHLYHGDYKYRGYNSREKILTHDFNIKDLEIDSNGLYKLNNKGKFDEIKEHFSKL